VNANQDDDFLLTSSEVGRWDCQPCAVAAPAHIHYLPSLYCESFFTAWMLFLCPPVTQPKHCWLWQWKNFENHSVFDEVKKLQNLWLALVLVPLLSNRRHLRCGDCLGDKREDYQNCLVLYCVPQLYAVISTHRLAVLTGVIRHAGLGLVLGFLCLSCVFLT